MELKTERLNSIEVFRTLAILVVVAHHANIFVPETQTAPALYPLLRLILTALARWVVILFFIVSGYFWGKKVRQGVSPLSLSLNSIKKLLLMFLAWSFIYLLPYNLGSVIYYGSRGPLLEMNYRYEVSTRDPLALFFAGTQGQLWFLVALACAMAITAFFVWRESFGTLALLSVSLYIVGMLGESYLQTPFGINIDFNMRHGPFLSTLGFVTGYFLSGLSASVDWLKKGALLFLLACLMQYLEFSFLFGRDIALYPTKYGFYFASYFGGAGLALAGLSNHRLLQNKQLSSLGKYTLGIYLCHFIFVENLKFFYKLSDSPLWEISSLLFTYALSLGLVMLLSKNTLTRKLVM